MPSALLLLTWPSRAAAFVPADINVSSGDDAYNRIVWY
jgi:hypothetical protein